MLPTMTEVIERVWRRHLQMEARRRIVRELDPTEQREERAVGFADLVGFTTLSQQVDDHTLAGIVDRFETIAYETVLRLGGRVVKMIGDEVMYVVTDPRRAVRIGLALAEEYAADEALSDVRVGIAYGPVLEREADLYGPVVNLASRIVNIAFPGSVVTSDEVRHAVGRPARPGLEVAEAPAHQGHRPGAAVGGARRRTTTAPVPALGGAGAADRGPRAAPGRDRRPPTAGAAGGTGAERPVAWPDGEDVPGPAAAARRARWSGRCIGVARGVLPRAARVVAARAPPGRRHRPCGRRGRLAVDRPDRAGVDPPDVLPRRRRHRPSRRAVHRSRPAGRATASTTRPGRASTSSSSVLGREGDWVNVRVSSRPNGRVAWVRAADVAFRRVAELDQGGGRGEAPHGAARRHAADVDHRRRGQGGDADAGRVVLRRRPGPPRPSAPRPTGPGRSA